jgi:uncharacterized repeat protein (TIGR03843 family)
MSDAQHSCTASSLDGSEPPATFLQRANIMDCELVPWGSNYTFAVLLEDPLGEFPERLAIYKPAAGEVPLWDFPDDTLYRREYAAYLVSRQLGWDFIPTTVIRDGPHGIGSVQDYVEPDKDQHYFAFRDDHHEELRKMALFDLATNNADRKASHCFRGAQDGRIWGIDHGLTFNVEPKLRTVIWDFQLQSIEEPLLDDLRRVICDEPFLRRLAQQLDPREVQAFRRRSERLLREGVYPALTSRRSIPWGW